MSGGELLVAGKALLWFALPIAFAVWQIREVRATPAEREQGPATEPPERRPVPDGVPDGVPEGASDPGPDEDR